MLEGLGNINVFGMVDTFFTGLLLLIALAVTGGVCYAVWLWMQYDKRVIVRELTGGGHRIKEMWAREKEHSDGTTWWHFFGNDVPGKMPRPESDCINITDKGRKYVECYKSDGAYIPVRDTTNVDDLKNSDKLENFQPFTTEQRGMLVDELARAEEYNTQKSMSEVVAQAVPYAALIILITVTLIFWEQAVSPMIEVGNTVQSTLDEANSIAGKIERMDTIQVIEGSEVNEAGNATPPNASQAPPG